MFMNISLQKCWLEFSMLTITQNTVIILLDAIQFINYGGNYVQNFDL